MRSLTFGLFTQVSDSGPNGPLVFIISFFHSCWPVRDLHMKAKISYILSLKS